MNNQDYQQYQNQNQMPFNKLSKKLIALLVVIMVISVACSVFLMMYSLGASIASDENMSIMLILLSIVPTGIAGYCLGFLAPRAWYLSVLANPISIFLFFSIIFTGSNLNGVLIPLVVSALPLIFGYIGKVSRIKKEQNQTLGSNSLNITILVVTLLVFIAGTLLYFDYSMNPEKYAKKDGEFINCGTTILNDNKYNDKNIQTERCFSRSEAKGCQKTYRIINDGNEVQKESITGQWEKGCLETTTTLKHTGYPEYVGKSYTCKVLVDDNGGWTTDSCSGELQDLMDANALKSRTKFGY